MEDRKTRFQYIDVHTHVNLSAYDEDREAVEERTLVEGVAHINVGTQKDTSRKAVELANFYTEQGRLSHIQGDKERGGEAYIQYDERLSDVDNEVDEAVSPVLGGVYATVGLHPVHTSKSYHDPQEFTGMEKGFVSRGEKFDIEHYRTLAQHEKVVAIGECGLDYFRVEKETKAVQEEAFIGQIALANELEKPLMLHIRPSDGRMDAYEDAITILKREAKVLGNVHFFAGTYEVAKQFWEMGYTTSFTGVITFASQYDEVVKNAPLEMLHAETDAPYVTPKPFRGQRNEPLHVREVYKRIAELRGEEAETVRLALLQNAQRLFHVSV